jgi:3-oxoacyl-[acyl-carrier protein] reductase
MKKVAFVTGGTRGIGLGIAKSLAKAGFDLAINGIRKYEEVKNVILELSEMGVEVIYCPGDISSQTDRNSMLNSIKDKFGYLNLLVNNAGVAPKERNDILEATEESFDYLINTNLKSTYFLTQSVANWMINLKKLNSDFEASIINITSISATVASINRGDYCISKAGLGMVTQLFAVRLGEFNIPVFEIRPGIIKTDMTAGVQAKYDALFANGLCLQNRWGLPEDIGRAVASLAKGDFGFSTGQVFYIDGGLTVQRL